MSSNRLIHYLAPFLIGFGIFLACDLVIALSPIHNTLDEWVENPLDLKMQALDRLPKVDILLLGSSRTYNGLDPTTLSNNLAHHPVIYNLGLPATEHNFMLWSLKDAVARGKKPVLAIVGVSEFMLQPDNPSGPLYYQKLLSHHPGWADEIFNDPALTTNMKSQILLTSLSGIFRYGKIISITQLTNKALFPSKEIVVHEALEKSGWQPLAVRPMITSMEHLDQFHTVTSTVLDTHRLQAMLDWCRKQQIRVVLLQMPASSNYREKYYPTPPYQNYFKVVKWLARQNNVPLINLNPDTADIDDSHFFADMRHLNRTGAQFYSRRLAEELEKLQ